MGLPGRQGLQRAAARPPLAERLAGAARRQRAAAGAGAGAGGSGRRRRHDGVLADQAPEALGGFLGAVLDHCQAARDVVRVAVAYFVVVVAVLVTTAAARMAAAVQPLDDAAERRVDALDVVAVELAPDAVLQLLQLATRVSNLAARPRCGRCCRRHEPP